VSLLPVLLVLVSQSVSALPPRLTDPVARTREFPKGDPAKANELNEAGLAARKAKKPAIPIYQAAVAAAPAFEPARYNLACEQARNGDAPAAIKSLEALHRLGTRASRKYLSLSRTDADFESLRSNPAYVALVAPFAVDLSKPILAQLCADFGRVGTLVDPSFAVHVMTEYKPQGKLSPPKKLKGGPARAAVYSVLDVWCIEDSVGTMIGDEGDPNMLRPDRALGGQGAPVCLSGNGTVDCAEDDPDCGKATDYESVLCFKGTKSGWNLVGVAHIDVSGDAPVELPIDALRRSLGLR
jgi:hypothetical protein